MDFPGLPYGTHEARHDLTVLIYPGASAIPTDEVSQALKATSFKPDMIRLPLVLAIHDVLTGMVVRGLNQVTIKNRIYQIRQFYAWCDTAGLSVTFESLPNAFRLWTEHLIQRVRIHKAMSNTTAYRSAKAVDAILKPCLGLKAGLIRNTRLSPTSRKHKALGSVADKQNLEDTFAFGSFLKDVVDSLSPEILTGTLPITITTRNGQTLVEYCGLQPMPIEKSSQRTAERNRFIARRAAIPADEVFAKRHSVVNLRIEAELLIFIAQTSMNLSQASKLKRGEFRFQSTGDDTLVYRVYKGRRGGEAEFRIFKEYAPMFKAYLEWLEVFSDPVDERLFPFVYPHKIPTADYFSRFQGTITRCKALGIRSFRPLSLRKTRINWLLRQSHNPDLVADMAQHTKEVLFSSYEEPHHQAAASEISRFYRQIDPAAAATGPGMCVATAHPRLPRPSSNSLITPDCSTPAGCLFCEFQRDIDSEEYVWSITTYKYLKALELDRYFAPISEKPDHPAVEIITRIEAKLQAFAERSANGASWVEESILRMREGRFHPNYDGLIQLMEIARA